MTTLSSASTEVTFSEMVFGSGIEVPFVEAGTICGSSFGFCCSRKNKTNC
jgi:hypothetical protein